MCYRAQVRGVCPNYEVVELQPRTVNPQEPRLCRLLLRIYTCPVPPHPTFLPPDVLPGGVAPSYHDTPYTDVCCVSTQDHPPTWESTVSVPEYKCSLTRPYHLLSVLPTYDPTLLPPHLPDSCRRCTLAAAKIASTVNFS